MTSAVGASTAPSPGASGVFVRIEGPAPPALSVMHQHLLNVVVSHLALRRNEEPVRVLDAGCGDGVLLEYLARSLEYHFPQTKFELYGFDVCNHGIQPTDYFRQTVGMLESRVPGRRWDQQLALISDRDCWPWPEGTFDVVVSNQVLEHVRDLHLFFSELRHTLAPGGFSVHVFPTRHCVVEPHLNIPFAHRIGSRSLTARYIELATRLGMGRYDARTETRRRFAVRHADYLAECVNYRRVFEIQDLATQCGLRGSFCHTRELYSAKARALLGRTGVRRYRTSGRERGARVATFPFRLLSSVTLLLTRDDAERPTPQTTAAEQ